ncbi:MAG: glycosyltransferase, partial [Balneolales bacterium]
MNNSVTSPNDTKIVNLALPKTPLVTIVIPTYNHGQFIGEAIESIFAQDYKNYEIVIIDDGSLDNTEEVVSNYEGIKYLKQKNQGLSASRNIGLQNSKGEYITFLDADDVLQPNAITTNVQHFTKNKNCAFVSGNHKRIAVDGREIAPPQISYISSNHYEAFLKGNYIGMHGTVMYNKKILLEEGGFNTNLAVCEDYDLYLRLSRKHKIFSHQQIIASYRQHDNNMSSNVSLMLKHALAVLKAQLPHVREKPELVKAYQNGVKGWKEYYTRQFIKEVKKKKNIWKPMKGSERLFLLKLMTLPYLTFKFKFISKKMIKPSLKKYLLVSRLAKYKKNFKPAVGKIKWGDLRRTIPISRLYGYDRGGPIDRYYIENFLAKHSSAISGRVLEIGDNEYTIRYGKENVVKSDVLHLHADNPKATFV